VPFERGKGEVHAAPVPGVAMGDPHRTTRPGVLAPLGEGPQEGSLFLVSDVGEGIGLHRWRPGWAHRSPSSLIVVLWDFLGRGEPHEKVAHVLVY
jgi:hypothetical protein